MMFIKLLLYVLPFLMPTQGALGIDKYSQDGGNDYVGRLESVVIGKRLNDISPADSNHLLLKNNNPLKLASRFRGKIKQGKVDESASCGENCGERKGAETNLSDINEEMLYVDKAKQIAQTFTETEKKQMIKKHNSRGLQSSEVVTIYEGNWGDWTGWRGNTSPGYFACGAQMRFEDIRPVDGTAGNGLRVKYCHINNWNDQTGFQTLLEGDWGDWKPAQMCPANKYINGAQVRFQSYQGFWSDDTALNGLKIHCASNGDGNGEWITVWAGNWGDWKTQVVRSNKMVQRMDFRYESRAATDDTAWNGLKFEFVPPNNVAPTGPTAPMPTPWPTDLPTAPAPTAPAPTAPDAPVQPLPLVPCFSSHSIVDVMNKGKISMDKLNVGDRVLTSKGYNIIYAIDHRHSTKMADFIQIHHEGDVMPLELTTQHMLYLHDKPNPVPAKFVNVGDHLKSLSGPKQVKKILPISRPGLFNPLTPDGTIVVNSVMASTYSAHLSEDEYIKVGGYRIMSQQKFFNRLLKPVEIVCTKVSLSYCLTSKERILVSHYGYIMLNYFMQQGYIYQSVLRLFALILALFFDFIFSWISLILIGFGCLTFCAKKKYPKLKRHVISSLLYLSSWYSVGFKLYNMVKEKKN